jgi:uncharacterized MAPEG superfamily protein
MVTGARPTETSPKIGSATIQKVTIMLVLSIIYAGALVWISAVVQHVQNLKGQGVQWVTSDRSKAIADDGFTGRSARALRNNVESALMYLPVALVAAILHRTSAVIVWVPVIYMVVRTTFTLFYWLKVNQLRSLSWLIGMICVLALTIDVAVAALS